MKVNSAYKVLFDSDKRFNVTWGGAGSSKSYSIAQKLLTKVISQEYCKPVCSRKNYVSIKDSCYALLLEVIENENLTPLFHITESPLGIKFKGNGNHFLFRGMNGAKDREKIKSILDPTDWWLEEANEFDLEDFRQVRLRLRGQKGEGKYIKQIYFSFNGVDDESWLFKDLIDNVDFRNRLLELNTTYKDNKFNDVEYIKELELLIKEDLNYYNVYTLGKRGHIDYRGRIYKSYIDEYYPKGNVCDYVYNPLLPIDICCDFNVDPMKWALIQNVRGIDYIFDEIIGIDTTTEEQIKKVVKKYGSDRVKYYVYGDYSGNDRHTSSETTDYQIIKYYIPNAELKIEPNPYVINRINSMNMRLCNAENVRRLLVSDKCVNVRYDLKHSKYKEGTRDENKTDEKYDGKNPIKSLIHISSAIGYRINYLYSLKGKAKITHGKAR